MIGGSGGGGSGAAGGGGAAVDGGGCGARTTPPPGSHLDCPLDPSCAGSYAEQLAKLGADGGACQGTGPIVTTAACGGKRIWRKAANTSLTECIYADSGALVGSESCPDIGCSFAGDVIDDATICADGGLGPNLCAPDASAAPF